MTPPADYLMLQCSASRYLAVHPYRLSVSVHSLKPRIYEDGAKSALFNIGPGAQDRLILAMILVAV